MTIQVSCQWARDLHYSAIVIALLRERTRDLTRPVSRFGPRKSETAVSAAELALVRSITYAALFEFPLTPAEARRTLVRCELSETELMALYRSSAFLQQRLSYRRGYFTPIGRERWIAVRTDRQRNSVQLIERHRLFLDVLSAMPFVKLAAISGSLAHLNATMDSDLDLFIVTKGRHVWTVTAAVVLISKLLGRRRTVCANYVVADTDLAVETRDEFAANQIVHLRPLFGADAYRQFLDANPFVRALYPNFDPRERRSFLYAAPAWAAIVKRVLGWICAIPGPVVEAVIRAPYGWYLRRKVRGWASPDHVRLTKTQLKLHGYSHRDAIAKRFEAAMNDAWPT